MTFWDLSRAEKEQALRELEQRIRRSDVSTALRYVFEQKIAEIRRDLSAEPYEQPAAPVTVEVVREKQR